MFLASGPPNSSFPSCIMTSSYAHVMDRQATISNRLESPITSNLDNLQAKKNFSVSHLLDLEEAGEMVVNQADESVGEAGRSMMESPGLTSGSDTNQQDSKSVGLLQLACVKIHTVHVLTCRFYLIPTIAHAERTQRGATGTKEMYS